MDRTPPLRNALIALCMLWLIAGLGCKKVARQLIVFPSPCPTIGWLRDNRQIADQAPFDGTVLDSPYADSFGAARIDSAVAASLRSVYSGIGFSRARFDFVRVNASWSSVAPWNDDDRWKGICDNLQDAAAVDGLILLDVEDYIEENAGKGQFTKRTPEDGARAKDRGAQAMRSLQAGGVRALLLTFAYRWAGRKNVLGQFLDGMVSAKRRGIDLIDGREQTYSWSAREFWLFRPSVRPRGMSLGSASWIDPNGRPREPAEFGEALNAALGTSDRYAWVFSWKLDVWNMTADQRRAIMLARRANGMPVW